jgi:hypothetical protein
VPQPRQCEQLNEANTEGAAEHGGGVMTCRCVPGATAASGSAARFVVALGPLLGCAACAPAARSTLPASEIELRTLERQAAEVCCRQRPACDLPPRSFTTDVCSMWPDGTWAACCVEHDVAYWRGGPAEACERADDAFRACMRAEGGPCSTLSYVGGPAWMPFPWRWGYGWDWLEDPR